MKQQIDNRAAVRAAFQSGGLIAAVKAAEFPDRARLPHYSLPEERWWRETIDGGVVLAMALCLVSRDLLVLMALELAKDAANPVGEGAQKTGNCLYSLYATRKYEPGSIPCADCLAEQVMAIMPDEKCVQAHEGMYVVRVDRALHWKLHALEALAAAARAMTARTEAEAIRGVHETVERVIFCKLKQVMTPEQGSRATQEQLDSVDEAVAESMKRVITFETLGSMFAAQQTMGEA